MEAELQFIFIVKKMEDSMLLRAMLMMAGYDKKLMTSVYRWRDGVERAAAGNGKCLLFMDKAFAQDEPDYEGKVRELALEMPIILVEDAGAANQADSEVIELGVQEVLSLREITSNYLAKAVQHAVERHQMRQQIRETALVDTLTGLYNRRGFFKRAEQAVAVATRLNMSVMVLFMDVDHMKWVNDTLSHQEGDVLLVEAANVLRTVFRSTDVIGRLGGDEFAVLLLRQQESAGQRATGRLQAALHKYNSKRKLSYPLSLSIGQAECLKGQTIDLETLLAQADENMYKVKKKKRGQAPSFLADGGDYFREDKGEE
ncbi:putative diguanylate cyclase YeaP [Sporomusa ovata DSM 2662]|uniref:GGDEF domain-containing protein n=2 Tax=Sporomusa ovata TaxID=2378 RepID=UPI00038837E3|nr:diguanylate cyclase [Sporomusa ovata]EQB24589.1 GGDEF domain containing protein [Sporomusa ovata DSM 2662]